MYVKTIRETLTGFPLPIYVCGTSALDLYFGVPGGGVVYAVCEGSMIDAAKSFPDIHYPGLRDADAVIDLEGFTLFLTFVDSLREVPENSVVPLNLLYDPRRRRYLDPYGVYYRLREQVLPVALPPGGMESWYRAGILAQTLSRYHYDPPEMEELPLFGGEELSRDEQRSLLAGILTGRSPDKGLRFLRECGFIDLHWPELAGMDQVDQAKEYHPEGNVWDHSLATFAHRKNPDLRLSLALLLHDIGKAGAEQVDGNRFHKHAQIGSSRAASFLRKMGFTRGMVDDVHFLGEKSHASRGNPLPSQAEDRGDPLVAALSRPAGTLPL